MVAKSRLGTSMLERNTSKDHKVRNMDASFSFLHESLTSFNTTKSQCCGSGSESWSVGSIVYVFGTAGSGSFYHQVKIVRKTLIFTAKWLLFDFLPLKNDVNVPLKSNQQNNFKKKFFVCILKVYDENSGSEYRTDPSVRGMDPRIQIRIHTKTSWIRNTAKSTACTILQTRLRLKCKF